MMGFYQTREASRDGYYTACLDLHTALKRFDQAVYMRLAPAITRNGEAALEAIREIRDQLEAIEDAVLKDTGGRS